MVKETQTKKAEKPETYGGSSGRNLRDKPMGESSATAVEGGTEPGTTQLMEAVVERSNMAVFTAYVASIGLMFI